MNGHNKYWRINMRFYEAIIQENQKCAKKGEIIGSRSLEKEIKSRSKLDKLIEAQDDKRKNGVKIEVDEIINKDRMWFTTHDFWVLDSLPEIIGKILSDKKDYKFMKILRNIMRNLPGNAEECVRSYDQLKGAIRTAIMNAELKGRQIDSILVHSNIYNRMEMNKLKLQCKVVKTSVSNVEGIEMKHRIFIFFKDGNKNNWAINKHNQTKLYIGRDKRNIELVSFQGYQLSYIKILQPDYIKIIEIE